MHKLFILVSILILGLFFSACNSSSPPEGGENTSVYTIENPDEERSTRASIQSEMALEEDYTRMSEPMPNDVVDPNQNTEEYDEIKDNPFKNSKENPLSTFSIDVDNAAYSNVRRCIEDNYLPPKGAVRIEEMINYFTYNYPQPTDAHPFSITTEIGQAPWNKEHQLVHIGLQGKSLDYNDLKPSNLVFLIDASGSMNDRNKLPLLKKALGLLLDQLDDKDKVAIVVYAGAAGLVLPSTPASQKSTILAALDQVNAGGSTAGGEGIELAYQIAKENIKKEGNNRVILATDGDFNVGVSSSSALIELIEEKRKDDIYLTICGFGMGNYKDGRMEQISNAGNGNYFYIDNIREAEKVFVKEMRANMFTIAKDVKLQIEFNPSLVKAYRLIGYENRMLAKEDFDDDTKDAGELGAGHTVTAIYEIIPVGSKSSQEIASSSNLKYQETTVAGNSSDLMTVKFRYKPLTSDKSILLEQVLTKGNAPSWEQSSENFRFSAAVAALGMILRDSEYKGNSTFDLALTLAESGKGIDKEGYRTEFIQMIKTAKLLGAQFDIQASK